MERYRFTFELVFDAEGYGCPDPSEMLERLQASAVDLMAGLGADGTEDDAEGSCCVEQLPE